MHPAYGLDDAACPECGEEELVVTLKDEGSKDKLLLDCSPNTGCGWEGPTRFIDEDASLDKKLDTARDLL